MFIPRELGIHNCQKCKGNLIDKDFYECGVHLQGENKWKVFFKYGCRHCNNGKPMGDYLFIMDKDELPGEIFRQLGTAVDIKFLTDMELRKEEQDA